MPAGIAPRIGGPAVMAFEAAGYLRANGIETTIFSADLAVGAQATKKWTLTEADLPPDLENVDVRLFRTRAPMRLIFSPGLDRALAREARDYDVIHIHNLWTFPQYAAFRHALRAGVPYVVAPCGALDPTRRDKSRRVKAVSDRLWQRKMLDHASVLHYKTEEEARRASDVVSERVPTTIIPNGIHWSRFQDLPDPGGFRERWLAGRPGPVVMTIGRISPEKDLGLLVRSFALVAKQVPEATLVIVGPDDEGLQAGLVALAGQLGVGDSVVFTGAMTGAAKLEALAAADVWVLTSWLENFGLAAVEALAAGRPSVLSDAVQISEQVGAAGAGLVSERRPEAFAEHIVRLLGDERLRAELGERARTFGHSYDWSSIGPMLAELYERARR